MNWTDTEIELEAAEQEVNEADMQEAWEAYLEWVESGSELVEDFEDPDLAYEARRIDDAIEAAARAGEGI